MITENKIAKPIFYKGRIYEGKERREDGYEVRGNHSWENGEDVTGKYELFYQYLNKNGMHSVWLDTTETEYNNLPEPKRIIAIPIESPTSTENDLLKEMAVECFPKLTPPTSHTEELSREGWISVETPPKKEGSYLAWVTKHSLLGPPQGVFVVYYGFANDEDAKEMFWLYRMETIELSHWMPLPAPPNSQPTPPRKSEGQGKEVTAMQELINEVNSYAFDYPISANQVRAKATELLAKEREQLINTYDAAYLNGIVKNNIKAVEHFTNTY